MSAPENPPAFPLSVPVDFQFAHDGMTLRDWFAGQAIAGGVANLSSWSDRLDHGLRSTPDSVAERAYAIADGMLEARAKAQAIVVGGVE